MSTETIEITPEVERLAKRPYRVVVSVDPEDGYIGHIPEMPGLLAVGDTPEEMFELVEDAKRAWIATALAQNRPVPAARTTDIPASKSGRFMVRLAPPIHAAIAREAEIHDISLNELVSTVLALVAAKGFDGFVATASRREITRSTKATTPEERREATWTLRTSALHDAAPGEDFLIGLERWGG